MRERRFDPALVLGTGSRCRFGCPRVIVCAPLQKFSPFPTTFWLTCPWLGRLIGAVEADGGVAKLESWIERHEFREWVSFNMTHQSLRVALLSAATARFLRRCRARLFERLRGGGVGGIQYRDPRAEREVHVKCIHLQTASWLALRRHPGAPWLEEKGLGGDCGGAMREFCAGI
ncbi:MAG: DUF501 domain-containing protein [Synergistaceae bacterium]|nr:DUF501 domain-containing protein [Synergistaceae bacterium]